jgi:hypothetical protein
LADYMKDNSLPRLLSMIFMPPWFPSEVEEACQAL